MRFLYLLTALLFASCATQVYSSLQRDGQAELSIYAALEPKTAVLISRLGVAFGGMEPGTPVLNGAAIAASMAAAPGISSAAFKNTAPTAIEGAVKVTQIGDFLATGMAAGGTANRQSPQFISFEQNSSATGGGGRCIINLSLESGSKILSLISPEIGEYFHLLDAPLATGIAKSKADFLKDITMMWGRDISDEISRATIRAIIDFPGSIQSVKGGTFSGRRAEFVIPLLDVMVLETPLHYEAVWK